MTITMRRDTIINSLRSALTHLYDPYELKKNPLQAILVSQSFEPGAGLKQVIINSINALMPDERTPADTKAWRVYELLSYRFVDQLEQKETAKSMMISIRTLQRLTPEAIEILGERLAEDLQVTLTDSEGETNFGENDSPEPIPLADAWTRETFSLTMENPPGAVDIRHVMIEISEVLRPISQQELEKVFVEPPDESWLFLGHSIFLRQAVLTAVSAFQRMKSGIHIEIHSRRKSAQGIVTIRGTSDSLEYKQIGHVIDPDSFSTLAKLMDGLSGRVEVNRSSPSEASISFILQVVDQRVILMVDDNADAIRLAGKFLTQSTYTLVGVQDPERVIPEINQHHPSLILLDIMMPNIDGWLLLSQIRHTPSCSNIPIIISTILPQEDLAISLGANGFIRKPFTREELLTTLETYALKSPALPTKPRDTGETA